MFPLAVVVHSNLLTINSVTLIILSALVILIGSIVVTRMRRASSRAVRALVQHFCASSAMDLACPAIACARSFWEVAQVLRIPSSLHYDEEGRIGSRVSLGT
jgi:hypothetical protein